MPRGFQSQVELLIDQYGGVDNANQFSRIERSRSPLMQNAWMPKIGSIGQRAGTIPVTTSALASNIEYLTTYKKSASASDKPEIYASSGTTLYKYDGVDSLDALTMTNNLNSSDIYAIGFTNSLLSSRLIIADGGILKSYDGTAVADIVPAADDPAPSPANALTDINAKGVKFVWLYNRHVFVSAGTNEIFYSKPESYNYFSEVNYSLQTHNNDYVNGAGLGFDEVMLVPMRRSWNIWRGSDFNNFNPHDYLNTSDGVIAPRSIQKVNYPDGSQTVIYLSDSGLMEIYTAVHGQDSKTYATRSLMKEVIDFEELGLTDSEKEDAVGFFDMSRSLYLLSFKKDGVNYTYAYDLRNREFYTDWLTFNAKSYVALEGVTYFAGDKKHLIKFDNNLYSDWNESTKTTGTPVYWKRYSALLSLEQTGYASYWDYFILEMRQYPFPSSIDVTVIFTNSSSEDGSNLIDASSAVWDESEWDTSYWTNEDYTETVNSPRRLVFKKKSLYTQVLLENNRDEPVELYYERWIGRTSGQ